MVTVLAIVNEFNINIRIKTMAKLTLIIIGLETCFAFLLIAKDVIRYRGTVTNKFPDAIPSIQTKNSKFIFYPLKVFPIFYHT